MGNGYGSASGVCHRGGGHHRHAGASGVFFVSRALSGGRRVAIASVLGNPVGESARVVAVAFGPGAAVERSIVAFTVVQAIGGLYLIYLGIRTFRRRGRLSALLAEVGGPRPDRASLFEGGTVGATDPKTAMCMAAILPQFVHRAAGSVPAQMPVLGLVFSRIAMAPDTCRAFAGGGLRAWFARSPARLEAIGGAGGLAIASLGAGLLLSGRRS